MSVLCVVCAVNCSKFKEQSEATPAIQPAVKEIAGDKAIMKAHPPSSSPKVEAAIKDTDTGTASVEIPAKPMEMVFVGDVMFGRYEETGLVRNPTDDRSPFQYVKNLLAADIAVANLETPLLREPYKKCPWPPRLRFAAGKEAASALADTGFHAVSLANNHVFDMRNSGVRDTQALLKEAYIVPIGVPVSKGTSPFVAVSLSAAGQTVAFIGITTQRNSVDGKDVPTLPYTADERDVPQLLGPVIAEARLHADRVIVLAHWGVSDEPAPSGRRRNAARALIDLGADAVIGHHSHVLQGIEVYKQGLIVHSLGDFLFDALWDERRLTGVLSVGFAPGRKCPTHVTLYPVVAMMSPSGILPRPARGFFLKSVIDRMIGLSRVFGTEWEKRGTDLLLKLPAECD